MKINLPVTDPGFSIRGYANPKGGSTMLLFWPIFPKKTNLHGNEKMWTERGAPPYPQIRQCPFQQGSESGAPVTETVSELS